MFDTYTQAALDAGLPQNLASYMPRYVQIESGGNPNAQTGSYSGLLQMGPDEMRRYGGNGLGSGAKMYADNYKWFTQKFGRDPSPTELYMVAQQGQGGIANHLANPDQPAWVNMLNTAEGRSKGEAWAKKAIWGNVPDSMKRMFGSVDNITSGQFVNDVWGHKVEQSPVNQAFLSQAKSNMTPMQAAMQPNDYAYAPNYDQNAGLFDRLRQGGPGALFGAPGGVLPGKDGQRGYDLGSHLQKAAIFALAANNPGALGALSAVNNQNNAQFVQIGTDEWGNPKYGFVDPRTRSVTPVGGSAATASDGSSMVGGQGGDAITSAVKSGLTGEDLLKSPGVPAGVAMIVRGIADGSQPFNPSTMMRTPQGRMALSLLDAYEPGVSPADYAGRSSGMKDWAGGKSNETARRAGQAIQHAATTTDQFGALGNTAYPAINAIKNTVSEQMGNGAPVAARQGVTALANEMGAFVRGNGGSDASFNEWAKNFPVNGSPEQQKASMGMLAQLFRESMNELEQKRQRAVGSRNVQRLGPLMSPEAESALTKLESYANSGKQMAPGVTSIKQIN